MLLKLVAITFRYKPAAFSVTVKEPQPGIQITDQELTITMLISAPSESVPQTLFLLRCILDFSHFVASHLLTKLQSIMRNSTNHLFQRNPS